MMPLLFVVDDDADLRSMLNEYLGQNGFEVVGIASGGDFLRRLPRRRPDLAIVDIMMPGTDGLATVHTLRTAQDDLPLILLTARNEDVDRIVGLELGADDYLGKPFNPRELLARIRSVLRNRKTVSAAAPEAAGIIPIGTMKLDLQKRMLYRDNGNIQLSSTEFALLRVFVTHPLKTFSRERLIEITEGRRDAAIDRSIDVRILRLRRLIEDDPQKPSFLQTVRRVGYVFVPQ